MSSWKTPFTDSLQNSADLEVLWQSKLRLTEELAEVALFLFSAPVSEAAVERTFSCQKHLDTPLRNRLHDQVVQAELFVRFNFMPFGDPNLVPPKLETEHLFHYSDFPKDEEDQADAKLCDEKANREGICQRTTKPQLTSTRVALNCELN